MPPPTPPTVTRAGGLAPKGPGCRTLAATTRRAGAPAFPARPFPTPIPLTCGPAGPCSHVGKSTPPLRLPLRSPIDALDARGEPRLLLTSLGGPLHSRAASLGGHVDP
ncbi:hypothetical protein NDU88_005068 [Pleurodeles waltl]|uniref:Uncharacterized protein n=1 Tax=Pleurodeles waltl TaxID=8319 RepID=A0AAV7TUD8_PLEWA|nr:hypothetical protein NDU88_005068 [Pleurodeles waltl]